MIATQTPANINLTGSNLHLNNQKQFINEACYADAPWQFTAMLKLRELSSQALSDLSPSQSTLVSARTAIAKLSLLNLPAPQICPVPGGSIGMIWVLGNKQLEVIFDEDQVGTFVLTKNDTILEDGEIGDTRPASLRHALDQLLCA